MDRKTTRIGFVCMGSAGTTGLAYARSVAAESRKYIQKQELIELIAPEGIVSDREAASAAADLFRQSVIDALVIQHGTYAPDALTLELIGRLPAPVAVWGIPEQPSDGASQWCGSMAGLLMHTSAMIRRERSFSFVFGLPDSAPTRKALDSFLGAAAVWRSLRSCRIGLLSHGGPGFHTAGIDSFTLKNRFGPEISYIDPSNVAARFERITDAEAQDGIAQCLSDRWTDEVNDSELLTRSARSFLAIRAIQQERDISALCMHRPAPGLLPAESGICLAHSRLQKDGIMTNTDDDLGGLVTMLFQHLLTGRPVFSGEWAELDERNNQVLFWNCCGAPAALANPRVGPALRRFYSGLDCVSVEFQLKQGDVTFARLLRSQSGYKLLIAKGRAVMDGRALRGAYVNVKFECDVNDLLNTILEQGFPHRYSLVYQDITVELLELAKMLGVETVMM